MTKSLLLGNPADDAVDVVPEDDEVPKGDGIDGALPIVFYNPRR